MSIDDGPRDPGEAEVSVRREDFEREACTCGECVQADVSGKPQRRDPGTGRWLHGHDLKRLYDAADRVLAQVKELAARKAMR